MRIFRARGKETLQGRAGTLQAVSLGSDERIYEDATGFVTQVISVGRHDKTTSVASFLLPDRVTQVISVGRHDKTISVASFLLPDRVTQVISVGRHDKTVSVGRHDKTTSVTSFILHIRMSNRDTSKTVNAIDKVAK